MSDRIVIVGGVACGPKAAARARRRDPQAEITVIEKGRHISYAGCGLPYYVGGTVAKMEQLWSTQFGLERDAGFFKSVLDVNVLVRTEATEIDRAAKRLLLKNLETGEETEKEYDKLVLATGAAAVRPPIEGINLKRVFCLQVPDDALRVRELIEADEVDRAVIIGGGSIGLEAAEALFAHAVDVTILERERQILPALLGPDMAALVASEMGSHGINIHTSQKVSHLEGDEAGRVRAVVTVDQTFETDMVLVAAGVRPAVNLAQGAGLEIGVTGAISVNEYLQTSDPDIFAGGDCVECTHRITGKPTFAPLGSTANKHGRIIGDNVTRGKETFPGIVGTAVLKTMGVNIARTGLTASEAERYGYDVIETVTPGFDLPHYFPGGKPIIVKLIVNRPDEKLLGAQIVGPGEAPKRIDILATALTWGATLKDVSDLDLAYAPPFSTAVDPVAHATNHTRNLTSGVARSVTAMELKQKMALGGDFILLDVRQPGELDQGKIGDERCVHIPLPALRQQSLEKATGTEIVTFCKTGIRSYLACRILQGLGYTNTKYLEGGLRAWSIVDNE